MTQFRTAPLLVWVDMVEADESGQQRRGVSRLFSSSLPLPLSHTLTDHIQLDMSFSNCCISSYYPGNWFYANRFMSEANPTIVNIPMIIQWKWIVLYKTEYQSHTRYNVQLVSIALPLHVRCTPITWAEILKFTNSLAIIVERAQCKGKTTVNTNYACSICSLSIHSWCLMLQHIGRHRRHRALSRSSWISNEPIDQNVVRSGSSEWI